MKPPPFAYRRPESLAEALDVLAGAGDEARPLAGGQSLLPLLAMRLARPSLLVDLQRVPELRGISAGGGRLRVGAMTREAELAASITMEREMVVSSCSGSPLAVRPTASRRSPFSPRKKTKPRSAPVIRNVASISVTRTSSRALDVLRRRATSRKKVSFSRSEASVFSWMPEI